MARGPKARWVLRVQPDRKGPPARRANQAQQVRQDRQAPRARQDRQDRPVQRVRRVRQANAVKWDQSGRWAQRAPQDLQDQ